MKMSFLLEHTAKNHLEELSLPFLAEALPLVPVVAPIAVIASCVQSLDQGKQIT